MHDSNVTPVRRAAPFKKKPKDAPVGHEAFLKALEGASAPVTIKLASDGTEMRGTVKTSDKFTISLKVDKPDGTYQTYVIYKSHIEMFWTNPHETNTQVAELAA